MKIKAYAKVNIGLDIKGVREDGYHIVDMIMQTVDLYDELTFEKIASGIELVSDNKEIPLGEDNLIYKAAALLIKEYEINGGVRITIDKNIPVAAGMAGGSTDCAATLRGVNEIYSLGLSEEKLREIGVKLGADVPYCIVGGTKRSEGIGEILTEAGEFPECTFLIAKPDFPVSTKEVYKGIDRMMDENTAHPDIDSMIECINKGDLRGITERMGNILEIYTTSVHPEIEEIKKAMKENGALTSLMSGSGPTVFGIFDDKEKALEAGKKVYALNMCSRVCVVGGINKI